MSALGDKLRALAMEADALQPVSVKSQPVEEGAQYLRDNPDVAKHLYFSKHPLEHWQMHGRAEGRSWPHQPTPPEATVTTPGGRTFPAPMADRGETFVGYCQRIGPMLGDLEGDLIHRTAGALFHGTDHLVPKNVKYPDDYAAYKSDPRNWPVMAEAFFYPTPTTPDPGWQQVHDKMKQGTHPAWAEPEASSPPALPDGETPL